EIFLNRSWPRF
ncbi:putative serine/threonine-kinase, partial [Vibrio parahaemolyticus V-223/04]